MLFRRFFLEDIQHTHIQYLTCFGQNKKHTRVLCGVFRDGFGIKKCRELS